MIGARLRQAASVASAVLSRLLRLPPRPRFLPAVQGGYLLEQVIAWERMPSGAVEVTLAVDHIASSRSRFARTRLLSPTDALSFLAAIDTVQGDQRTLATLTAERDGASKRCMVLEAAIEALHDRRTVAQPDRFHGESDVRF